MLRSYSLLCLSVLLCLLPGTGVLGQRADSLRLRLGVLERERQVRMLKDTDYLRAVDSIAPLLELEDSLPEWLSTYRDIAFADPRPGRHRAFYYTYLALNAYNTKKLGSAIYYAEKNNEERLNAGMFEKGGLSHSEMFAMVVYYNNHDYLRVSRQYRRLAAVLGAMPAAAAAGRLSGEQAFVGLSILQVAVFAYGKTGDTAGMYEAFGTARRLLASMEGAVGAEEVGGLRDAGGPGEAGGIGRAGGLHGAGGSGGSIGFLPRYEKYRPQFSYLYHSLHYQERVCGHDPAAAARWLYAAIEDVRDTAFPESMRADYLSGLYSLAVEFYTDQDRTDSVRHYLQLLKRIGANARLATADSVFLIASEGYLLGEEGHYEEAYRQLKKAYQLRDSAFYLVASDRDNNLYALAEADNAHAEMLRAEEKKRKAEQSALYLFFAVFVLVLAGIVIWFVGRWRQRQRLLNLKLGLARNFHDAVGPMLLYANALVKRALDDQSNEWLVELKAHIGRIMDEVRGIAYDLKSDRLPTVADLAQESTALLEKLRDAGGTDFTLKVENGDKLLSHIQHTHLWHIIRELIANSVKHAGGDKISLELNAVSPVMHTGGDKAGPGLKAMGPALQLRYSDDGKGMDPSIPRTGIGLQNIEERVSALNGDFVLRNAWPEGYVIFISIPLHALGGRAAGLHDPGGALHDADGVLLDPAGGLHDPGQGIEPRGAAGGLY